MVMTRPMGCDRGDGACYALASVCPLAVRPPGRRPAQLRATAGPRAERGHAAFGPLRRRGTAGARSDDVLPALQCRLESLFADEAVHRADRVRLVRERIDRATVDQRL